MNRELEQVSTFQIVDTEWRELYDREWGLGLVVSVDQGDKRVWVIKIGFKLDRGYFLTNRIEMRHISKLRSTRKAVEQAPLILVEGLEKEERHE